MSKTFMGIAGGLFELLPSTPSEAHVSAPITLELLATSLGRIPRYGTHTRAHYSVAEHSMAVADILPEHLKLHGLLHDAHEVLMGDMISPVANAMDEMCPGFKLAWNGLKLSLDTRIYSALGLQPRNKVDMYDIHEADMRILVTECYSFGGFWREWAEQQGYDRIEGWEPQYLQAHTARDMWLIKAVRGTIARSSPADSAPSSLRSERRAANRPPCYPGRC